MKNKFRLFLCVFLMIYTCCTFANSNADKNITIVKDMFENFSEKLNIKVFDKYYTKDFVLVSNNKSYDYAVYKKQQMEIFKTLKNLKVLEYGDIFSCGDKVTVRVTIKLQKKNGNSHIFYVMFIAKIKHDKIDNLWELTYPTWSDKLPTGKS